MKSNYYWLYSLLLLFSLSACYSTRIHNPKIQKKIYQKSIEEAMSPTPSKIYNDLVTISKENNSLIWKNFDGEDYLLRLPKTHIGKFITHEDAIYAYADLEFNKREKPLPELTKTSNRIRYRVRSGDFLGKIAKRYGVKVSSIKRWNGLRSNSLKIGQHLIIYPRYPDKVVVKKSIKPGVKMTTKGTYKVKSGDTLYGIAKKYAGVSAANIESHNNLSGSSLKPGMVLKIPKS